MPPVEHRMPALMFPLPLASESEFSETMPVCAKERREVIAGIQKVSRPPFTMAKVPAPVTLPSINCWPFPSRSASPSCRRVVERDGATGIERHRRTEVRPVARVLPLNVIVFEAAPGCLPPEPTKCRRDGDPAAEQVGGVSQRQRSRGGAGHFQTIATSDDGIDDVSARRVHRHRGASRQRQLACRRSSPVMKKGDAAGIWLKIMPPTVTGVVNMTARLIR